jgi:hypothetical protein
MAENPADLSKSQERNVTYRILVHADSAIPMSFTQVRCKDGIPELTGFGSTDFSLWVSA